MKCMALCVILEELICTDSESMSILLRRGRWFVFWVRELGNWDQGAPELLPGVETDCMAVRKYESRLALLRVHRTNGKVEVTILQ